MSTWEANWEYMKAGAEDVFIDPTKAFDTTKKVSLQWN